jgi:hypothetical protein
MRRVQEKVYHPPPPGKGKNAAAGEADAAVPAADADIEGPPADAPVVPKEPFDAAQVHADVEAAKQQ